MYLAGHHGQWSCFILAPAIRFAIQPSATVHLAFGTLSALTSEASIPFASLKITSKLTSLARDIPESLQDCWYGIFFCIVLFYHLTIYITILNCCTMTLSATRISRL